MMRLSVTESQLIDSTTGWWNVGEREANEETELEREEGERAEDVAGTESDKDVIAGKTREPENPPMAGESELEEK